MMSKTKIYVFALMLLFMGASHAAAAEKTVVGEVIAGEQGYEVSVEVVNWKDKAIRNVSVKVSKKPQALINFTVKPQRIKSLGTGETAEFLVKFDVAEDAAPQDYAEIVFSISAIDAEFDVPHPMVAVTIVKAKDIIAGGAGEGGPGTEDGQNYVFVLSEIKVSLPTLTEHRPGQLGYVERIRDRISTRITVVRCVECPTRIVAGESIYFQADMHTRYDTETYRGLNSGDRWPSELSIKSNIGFEAYAAGQAMHFPSIEELGIKPREVRVSDNIAPIPVIDPVGLTLEESLSLSAEFKFIGSAKDLDNDPVFNYVAKYSTDGRISRGKKDGKITVEYDNRFVKTPENLMGNVIWFTIGALSLKYTLQVNDKPKPVDVASFVIPSDFDKPPLDGQHIAVDLKKEKPKVHDVSGMSKKLAEKTLKNLGLNTKVKPGKPAPTKDKSLTVERTEPQIGSTVNRGDTVTLIIHTPFVDRRIVPKITRLSPLKEVKKRLKNSDLTPKIKIVKATSPQQSGKVKSLDPPSGTQMKPGSTVLIHVFGPFVKTVKVLKVKGLPEKNAIANLRTIGLQPTIIRKDNTNDRGLAGTVRSQNPAAGIEVKHGKIVELVVYKPLTIKVRVPKLEGKTKKEAKRLLAEVRLKPKFVIGKAAPRPGLENIIYETEPSPLKPIPVKSMITVKLHGKYVSEDKIILTHKMEQNSDRRGWDYQRLNMNTSDPGACYDACYKDSKCKAWTFVKPGIKGKQAVCYLKKKIPPATESNCCVSGVFRKRVHPWDDKCASQILKEGNKPAFLIPSTIYENTYIFLDPVSPKKYISVASCTRRPWDWKKFRSEHELLKTSQHSTQDRNFYKTEVYRNRNNKRKLYLKYYR